MTDVALLVRHLASGRDHAAQLPALPAALRPADGTLVDLASIDVLRVRERGVPRYNEFRRLLHLKAFDTFEEMADTPEHADGAAPDLRRRRAGRHDDRHVRRAEAEGVRLQRHRLPHLHPDGVAPARERPLLHRDYRPEVYTQEGLDWVEANSMRTLLLRHFPELEPALRGVENPFAPWPRPAPRVTELAPGDPQPRPRQGRPRPRVPDRDRRRAVARRHAVRGRRAARARRDPRARPQPPT